MLTCAVPRISLTPPAKFFARDLERIVRAISKISSRVMLPLCLMFFSFFRSRGGSAPEPVSPCSGQSEKQELTLERTDDQGAGGRNDGNLGLSVLDRELHRYAQTLPCTSRLCDIFSDLLRGLHPNYFISFALLSLYISLTRPRGPILGASAEDAPTSPPVARR